MRLKRNSNIAKTLLFSYIDGKQMKEVFKPSFIDGLRAYCLHKFFPHFAHIAYFIHKDKLNFERKTSCCVEGIIHGIKNKKSGITSNMSVDNSVMKINEQAEHRNRMYAMKEFNSLDSTPIWSNTETAPYVTQLGEANLHHAWS